MWSFTRRILIQNRIISQNVWRKNVRLFSSKPGFVPEKQSIANDESFKASDLFKSTSCKEINDSNLSEEITEYDISKVVSKFIQMKEIRGHCIQHGIDGFTLDFLNESFRRYCLQVEILPIALINKFYDIHNGAAHPSDLFPEYLKHAQEMLPQMNCVKDLLQIYYSKQISHLKQISELKQSFDLTNPPSWYPQARKRKRNIIFHAGPTNSGKTYRAMQRFLEAKSGIYCSPLRLLALEIFQKSNEKGIPCDLVTGEEMRRGNLDGIEANHLAITTEMTPVDRKFDVAIIDEIQLLNDPERGWAWTRALLGLNAGEIHVCGEAGTRELIERLCASIGETVEYKHYDRLTELTIDENALESYKNLQHGDCVICFNKNDIYSVSRKIEKLGKEVAVIYGSLPPNIKLAQAAKFNDPNNPCNILIASDAIGMGLNLSIRRIIFLTMKKLNKNRDGVTKYTLLSISQTLQIAGRAGRFGTQWEHGYVTTFKRKDLPTLKRALAQKPEPITQAGLQPTVDRIESHADYLPNSSLSNLMDIFTSISTLNNDLYFMCNMNDFIKLADMIQHIDLPLRVRYVYCCTPVNPNPFVYTIFTMFVNMHSQCKSITYEFIKKKCKLPAQIPKSTNDLKELEIIFEVLHIYLWLSCRFADMYPHGDQVRAAQAQLDEMIQKGFAQKGFWS